MGTIRMSFSLAKLFVGRPVANSEAEGRKLNVFTGLGATERGAIMPSMLASMLTVDALIIGGAR
jgi:hypothetical protein